MEGPMLVRLRSIRKISRHDYRLALDLIDPDRHPWDYGDCIVQVDLQDGRQHLSRPRGPLMPALELYQLAPDDPPSSSEALILWQMVQAVQRYVDRLIEAGILCPFDEPTKDDAPERRE
jgi:hypothetical protein